MLISRLLKAIDIVYKQEDADIKFITDDSRECNGESVFVCDKKGSCYIKDALNNGARLVISEDTEGERCIKVPDARKAYALLCSEFFGNSHKRLRLVAVTGTN